MTDTLDRLKLDLVSEYEQSGDVNIADWVSRYPAHRDELVDFWMFLSGTPRSGGDPNTPDPERHLEPSEIADYEEALKDACLAVTFGPSWLTPPVDPEREALGKDLETLRRQTPSRRSASAAFKRAVVFTWVVSRLQRTRPRVTRLAAQKVIYVLEHAMRLRVFVEHERKPLGPYDHKARYKDAEPIARKKRWLTIKDATLRAADDLSGMSAYLGPYLHSKEVAARLVDCLAPLTDDELETLATVHWIARELDQADRQVTAAVVEKALAETSEWSRKLTRANFTRPKLREALRFLRELRLVPAEE